MLMNLLLFLAILVVPAQRLSSCDLQEPPPPPPAVETKAAITATKDGGLTILDAAKSTGAKSYAWQIVPAKTPGFIVVDAGQRAIFAPATAGSYVVILAVAGADGQLDIATHAILSGPAPGPGPPGPAPPPATLAEQVTGWVAMVTSDSRKAEAEKIANSFDTVASQIAAGAVEKKPETILAATKASYDFALGAARPAWQPFFEALGAYMNAHDSGLYVEQWQEIAKGLRGAP